MFKFLATRRHNAIDGLGFCIVAIAIHDERYMVAAGVLLVGALISAAVELVAGNAT